MNLNYPHGTDPKHVQTHLTPEFQFKTFDDFQTGISRALICQNQLTLEFFHLNHIKREFL